MEAGRSYPFVARIFVDAAKADDDRVRELLAGFDLLDFQATHEPTIVMYSIWMQLADKAEVFRLYEAVRAVPGIRRCIPPLNRRSVEYIANEIFHKPLG